MPGGAEVVETEVVDHDEQHVRPLLRGDAGHARQEGRCHHDRKAAPKSHVPHGGRCYLNWPGCAVAAFTGNATTTIVKSAAGMSLAGMFTGPPS